MAIMTKKSLAQKICAECGYKTTDALNIINMLLEEIKNCLIEGNQIQIRDFGVFKTVLRKSKIGRNPRDAKVEIRIPTQMRVKFQTSKNLNKLMNKD